jgi:methyl-accepting chemotaxis protein
MISESDDLAILRETTSKTLLAVLWLHAPIAVTIGMVRGTDWLMPAVRSHSTVRAPRRSAS